MYPTPEPARATDLDAIAVEAVLTGTEPSGDAVLDETLEGLRALVTTPPEPNPELAQLLGPAAPSAAGDEVGRRRQGGARHLATGTTVVVGVVLATATAAAAMGGLGGLGGLEHTTAPNPHRAVVAPAPSEATPHPTGTTPTQLPNLPVAAPGATHEDSDQVPVQEGKVSGPSELRRRSRSSDESEERDDAHDATQDDERDSSTRDSTPTQDDDEQSSRTSDDEDSTAPSTGDRDEREDGSEAGSQDQEDPPSDGTGSGQDTDTATR
jgi:hypothetical protein